ncbi:MAG: hypothetical protein LW860_08540 [Xanthomonadaceae bacterium]|jgi:hypothetical protein|nr:hypothetical protein [Xanthomonadaceae bacterium]
MRASPAQRLAIAFLLALLLAPAVQARVFSGIVWGAGGLPDDPRRLDVHAPAAPGPHPLLVVVDVPDGELVARALAARGRVVALLAPGQVARREALADALAFLYWRGPTYGADSSRLDVVAAGEAADALLALARDPAPLHGAGVPEGSLRAVVLAGAPAADADGAPPPALALPSLLLVAPAGDEAARIGAARIAERWRGFGAAAEAVEGREARVGGESIAAVLHDWLPAVAMPRVPRFESIRFDAEAEDLPDAAPVAAIAALDGALFVAADGAALSVWRRGSAQAPWQRELSAPAARVLHFGSVATAAGVRLALVTAGDSGWSLRLRDPSGSWGPPRVLGDPRGVRARAAWLVALPDAAGGGAGLLVAVDADAASRVFRLRADGRLGTEALADGERITGLVAHAGVPLLAVHGPRGGRLLRRVGGAAGAWVTAVAWEAARGSLSALASLAPEADAAIGVLDDGSAVRLDPARGTLVIEADLREALRHRWGRDAGIPRAWAAPMQALHQPHGGDRVHVAGIALHDPREPPRAGWYVVRQAGGHYAYGRAGDPAGASGADATLRAMVASPFVVDAGTVVYALTAGDPPRLWRGSLGEPRMPTGAWVDRHAPDVGLFLDRTRAGWLALLHRIDGDRQPRWYSAGGQVRNGTFEDSTGLLRYRMDDERRLQAETLGRMTIRFGAAGADRECAGRDGAWALAVVDVRIGDDAWTACLEPLAARERQRPAVDGSGIWMAPDGAWGMAVQSDGHGADGAERVLFLQFDRDGLPTWRLGRGERRAGDAVVALPGADGEVRLSYGFRGVCGAIEASARVDGPGEDGAAIARGEATLLRGAGGACY